MYLVVRLELSHVDSSLARLDTKTLDNKWQGWQIYAGTKWVRLAQKWDKSGTFSDQISVHFGSVSRFVLFRANLTHFAAKSDIPGLNIGQR